MSLALDDFTPMIILVIMKIDPIIEVLLSINSMRLRNSTRPLALGPASDISLVDDPSVLISAALSSMTRNMSILSYSCYLVMGKDHSHCVHAYVKRTRTID